MQSKDFNKALNYSFLLLKYRARSKNEIISRLKIKGYNPSIQKEVINYLKEYNYINDRDFTGSFVVQSLEKGWGPRRIDYKLKKFGIGLELRKKALEGIEHKERIKVLIEGNISFYVSQENISQKKIYQRIIRSLTAKGFDYNDIFQVLEELGVESFEDR